MRGFHERSYNSVWMLLGLFVVVGAFTWTGDTGRAATDALMLRPEAIVKGEVWRLVTYAFLTAGSLELLFKLLVFYYIAAPLEAAWGTRRFLTLFAVSVVGGGATAALLGVSLAGGWAVTMTLMLVHGFIFPESRLYLFFILPIRVKTLAIISAAFYLVGCVLSGFKGLALFAGLFSGAIYYVIVTKSLPWVRRARYRVAAGSLNPGAIVKDISNKRLMERARRIIKDNDGGRPLTADDRAFVEELVRRADPSKELCSPYSFSPDNRICPPCREFGRCLRRYLESRNEAADESH